MMQVQEQVNSSAPLKLLHVGCGRENPQRLPRIFRNPQWQEVRLDIDSDVNPDIIGNIVDMKSVTDASMDAIWSSHNLEHLNWFEVPIALREFKRVLKPDGFLLISVPDLRAIAQNVLNDRLNDVLYNSAAGPITPMDMLFGHQSSISQGNTYMSHRTGFTASTLGKALCDAGFEEVRVHEGSRWDLWAVATLSAMKPKLLSSLAGVME